jgi:ring-1,2-phenylacetyl-CoA epoxidase subunit PaaC
VSPTTGIDEGEATNAYQSLAHTTEVDDPRWAFGAEVAQSGVEITAPVPSGVDPSDVAEYCTMLADDALIGSQRLTEWVTNAPELEEEVALANVALDLLGQARLLLARAGHLRPTESTTALPEALREEDRLAFWRDQAGFRCVALVELDDELDFARCIARLLIFSSWRLAVLNRLLASRDGMLAAVADKAVKELTYHRDYAAGWAVRLGDGTELSHVRMQAALDWVWPWSEELFRCSETEQRLAEAGVAVDPRDVRDEVDGILQQVIDTATLTRPDVPPVGTMAGRGGRQGVHTEKLGPLLAEMQSLARQHPDATW